MVAAFLITLAVMCGLTLLLTVIILIAEATIGNYGDAKLTINGRRELTVRGGKPLLATLKEQNIFIPSACGGRGSCGLCKLKVDAGAGVLAPTELPWLNESERKAGIRLSCQVKVKKDMSITIPEELLSVRQFLAEVSSIRDLTYDIKEVRLRLLEPAEVEFQPGQFMQLEVPPYELSEEAVYRAYSLSSDCRIRNGVEMEIRLVQRGICTTYVHKHLKVGQKIAINGPYGDFYLRNTDRDIIFIAGGSGMAPIKSMLHEMAHTRSTRKALYFFGARSARDLFLLDEMKAFEQQIPNFRFIPSLSGKAPEDSWAGETGLVTDVLDRHCPKIDNAEAYLCGSPMMIDACVTLLKKKGLPESQIFYDKFA